MCFFYFTNIVENFEERSFFRDGYLIVINFERDFESHSIKICGFKTIGGGRRNNFCFRVLRRGHAEKIDDEDTTIWQLEDFVRSPDSKAVQLRVWAEEAKRKEEENGCF